MSKIGYGWFSEMASKQVKLFSMEDTEYSYCHDNSSYGVIGLYYIHIETGKLVQVTAVSEKKGDYDEYMWDDKEYVGPVEINSARIIPHHEAEEYNKYII